MKTVGLTDEVFSKGGGCQAANFILDIMFIYKLTFEYLLYD